MNRLLGSCTVLLALAFPGSAQSPSDHQRNLSDCRDGFSSCDRTKLSEVERTALAVAEHQNNVTACNEGLRSCDHPRLTLSEARAASAAGRLRNLSDCKDGIGD